MRTSTFQLEMVSADDTSAASDLNGNAGISPFQGSWLDGQLAFYWQLSGKPLPALQR
jgi:hypothetical protein